MDQWIYSYTKHILDTIICDRLITTWLTFRMTYIQQTRYAQRANHYSYVATACRGYHMYLSKHITLPHSYISSHITSITLHTTWNHLWRVLALLPLGVNEASTAAVRLCRARTAYARRAVAAQLSAEAKEDGGEEVGCYGAPCKAHKVAANVGVLTSGAEDIATLDDPDAVDILMGFHRWWIHVYVKLTS